MVLLKRFVETAEGKVKVGTRKEHNVEPFLKRFIFGDGFFMGKWNKG